MSHRPAIPGGWLITFFFNQTTSNDNNNLQAQRDATRQQGIGLGFPEQDKIYITLSRYAIIPVQSCRPLHCVNAALSGYTLKSSVVTMPRKSGLDNTAKRRRLDTPPTRKWIASGTPDLQQRNPDARVVEEGPEKSSNVGSPSSKLADCSW